VRRQHTKKRTDQQTNKPQQKQRHTNLATHSGTHAMLVVTCCRYLLPLCKRLPLVTAATEATRRRLLSALRSRCTLPPNGSTFVRHESTTRSTRYTERSRSLSFAWHLCRADAACEARGSICASISNEKDAETTSGDTKRVQKILVSTFSH
jgi:hypothetical protein